MEARKLTPTENVRLTLFALSCWRAAQCLVSISAGCVESAALEVEQCVLGNVEVEPMLATVTERLAKAFCYMQEDEAMAELVEEFEKMVNVLQNQ